MAEFDPRIVIVGVEVDGRLKTYEGLNVAASGEKFANALQNEATIQITNLDKATRDYLLTETSPYSPNRKRKLITLDAGRESTGAWRVFAGDVVSATISQPPDIDLTLKARTGNYYRGEIVSKSHPTTNLSVIAGGVAKDLGLRLVFEAKDKKIGNYQFTGAAEKQVSQLGSAGGVDAFIDDQNLVVKNRAEPLQHYTSVLSEESGMIGIPEVTDKGVKVAMLLVPGVQLGGRLTLASKMNPALNGNYTIYKLSFEITSRDTAFYWIAECWRPGAAFRKTQ
jgi:hypothetical protein